LPSPEQLPNANLGDPSLTFDQNSPHTKVEPAFTNVLKKVMNFVKILQIQLGKS
jgi:hypothetical protein